MKIIPLNAALVVLCVSGVAHGDAAFFNSPNTSGNAETRQAWLDTIGIDAPDHLVNFESGFDNGQNIHAEAGLFPMDMVILDSAGGQAIITSGSMGGSNPVGVYSVSQNELPFLELDFTASPVDYVGLQDIDHAGTNIIVTFVGGATQSFSIETTAFSGDSAEFVGFSRNDMPRIERLQFDASGDGSWGIDTIEYGVITTPCPADLDGSGAVGAADLAALLAAWGACPPGGPCPADLDGDLNVGPGDLAVLLAAWGPCR